MNIINIIKSRKIIIHKQILKKWLFTLVVKYAFSEVKQYALVLNTRMCNSSYTSFDFFTIRAGYCMRFSSLPRNYCNPPPSPRLNNHFTILLCVNRFGIKSTIYQQYMRTSEKNSTLFKKRKVYKTFTTSSYSCCQPHGLNYLIFFYFSMIRIARIFKSIKSCKSEGYSE